MGVRRGTWPLGGTTDETASSRRKRRWLQAPAEELASLKTQEKYAKSLTDECVDVMSISELHDALRKLCPGRVLDTDEAALRRDVKVQAAELHHKCRAVRKGRLSEAVKSGGLISTTV